jgi:hypothetical protein
VEKAVKDVMVVTSCTGEAGLAHAYDLQLKGAGIDHCFETVPFATSSFFMEARLQYWHDLAVRFQEYKMIVITDAWDVLFFGTKDDLLDKLQHSVLMSSEQNCFPGPEFGYEELTDKIDGPTAWKYANPGMVAADPVQLIQWVTKARKTVDLEQSDQAWCNRRLYDSQVPILLDYNTSLFYVISYNDGRLEDGSLQIKDGRLWNATCDTYPNFFHFAGHGPLEAKRVLPGHDAPRYDAMRTIRLYIETMR